MWAVKTYSIKGRNKTKDFHVDIRFGTFIFKWVKMPRWNYNISLYFLRLPTFSLNDLICILTKDRRGKEMATEQRREKRAPSGPIPRAVHVLRVSSNDWKGAGPQGWFQSKGKTCKLRVFHKASVQNTTKFSLSLTQSRCFPLSNSSLPNFTIKL